MKKSSILIALSILIITGLWIWSGQFKEDDISKKETESIITKNIDEINVRTKKSIAQEINKTISIQGQTKANREINIKSEIHGKIIKINNSIGKKIGKNEILFKISEDDKRTKFDKIKIEYESEKKLFEKGLSSKLKLATIKSEYESIKNDLDKTTIKSPFEGIITSEHLEIGEFVQPGTTLATFVELNPILVIGYVSEKELKNILLGTDVSITTSLDQKINGIISYISSTAEKNTRTFKIEIKLDNENYEIKDGLTATIKIQSKKTLAHKISPSILSLRDNGQVGVKIVNTLNKVEFFPIEVISDTKDGMWISGLPKNSNIIIVGQEYAPVGKEVNFEEIE